MTTGILILCYPSLPSPLNYLSRLAFTFSELQSSFDIRGMFKLGLGFHLAKYRKLQRWSKNPFVMGRNNVTCHCSLLTASPGKEGLKNERKFQSLA